MKKRMFLIGIALVLLGGCASVKMQPATLATSAKPATALVTFVRPAVFFGDGVSIDVWDGQNYVGALSAGSLIQYDAQPGKHLFLAKGENWSYASADLEAGKHYVIKGNIFPGVVSGRVALGTVPPGDARMADLLALKPTSATEGDRKDIGAKKRDQVSKALADFEAGKVTSFARVLPSDGR